MFIEGLCTISVQAANYSTLGDPLRQQYYYYLTVTGYFELQPVLGAVLLASVFGPAETEKKG